MSDDRLVRATAAALAGAADRFLRTEGRRLADSSGAVADLIGLTIPEASGPDGPAAWGAMLVGRPVDRVRQDAAARPIGGDALLVALGPGGEATIGRGDDADLRIDDDHVSRRHALVNQDDGSFGPWSVTDISTNGTDLVRGGVLVRGGKPQRVKSGEYVVTGSRAWPAAVAHIAPPAEEGGDGGASEIARLGDALGFSEAEDWSEPLARAGDGGAILVLRSERAGQVIREVLVLVYWATISLTATTFCCRLQACRRWQPPYHWTVRRRRSWSGGSLPVAPLRAL